MPKRIRDITKIRAIQHRIVGKAILHGTSKAYMLGPVLEKAPF